MPDETDLPEDAAEESDSNDAYGRRNARLRARLARWLTDAPYLNGFPKALVRMLVETDDAAAVAHTAYVAEPSNIALAKAYVSIAQRREVLVKLLADSRGSEG